MRRLVEDGMNNPDEVFVKVQKKWKKCTRTKFDNLWIYIKPEENDKEACSYYMTNMFEGNLWIREAFMKAMHVGR